MHKDTQLVCFIIILVLVAISWKGAQAAKFQHDDDDSFPNDDIIDKRGTLVCSGAGLNPCDHSPCLNYSIVE
jgi:hypothetical protein